MMADIQFHKYSAAGNDFIILDNRPGKIHLTPITIKELCHRHFGIGADGILLLETDPKHDYRMVYFNADGSRGEMCGNGARALCAFAGLIRVSHSRGSFIADDGPHEYRIEDDQIWIEILAQPTHQSIIMEGQSAVFIDTGVPHVVLPVADIVHAPVETLGFRLSRASTQFPQGANINFIEMGKDHTSVRTFERGVDAETLACGTGATACAIFLAETQGKSWPIALNFPGGTLTINYSRQRYWLTGPVELVFEGQFSANRLCTQ